MITIKTESALPDNKVRRRYEVTLTDLLGEEHTEIVGMFNHDKSNDGSGVKSDLLESKKAQEIERYKEEIKQGNNPFSTVQALWNSRTELLKAVLSDALSLPATDPMVYNGLPYLSNVTDDELMVLFDKDQLWVDDVRTNAQTLLQAKASLDNYQAVL